ncbi:unnamed protein product [Linum trigynum]|uniref:Uncharacterized protein n=1 Tax=Linum trigynum TaxID=586398 RepID=A0AAV2EBS5_9ROSI
MDAKYNNGVRRDNFSSTATTDVLYHLNSLPFSDQRRFLFSNLNLKQTQIPPSPKVLPTLATRSFSHDKNNAIDEKPEFTDFAAANFQSEKKSFPFQNRNYNLMLCLLLSSLRAEVLGSIVDGN